MQAIIFTGLQTSGKSSFYRENFRVSHERVSLDMVKSSSPKEHQQLNQLRLKNVLIKHPLQLCGQRESWICWRIKSILGLMGETIFTGLWGHLSLGGTFAETGYYNCGLTTNIRIIYIMLNPLMRLLSPALGSNVRLTKVQDVSAAIVPTSGAKNRTFRSDPPLLQLQHGSGPAFHNGMSQASAMYCPS